MDSEINLLPQRKGNIFRSEKTLARTRMVAVLTVMLVISSGIGGFFLNQINSPSHLQEQQNTLSSTLIASKSKAISQLQLLDRLNHIQVILSNRSTLENNIAIIQKQIPASVSISSFSLDSKALTFSVTATNLNDIDKVISNMTTLLNSKKLIKKMTVEAVVADQKSGRYSLSLDATL